MSGTMDGRRPGTCPAPFARPAPCPTLQLRDLPAILLGATLAGTALLTLPWTLGLLVRFAPVVH